VYLIKDRGLIVGILEAKRLIFEPFYSIILKTILKNIFFETLNESEGNLGEWDGKRPFANPTISTAFLYTQS